MCKNVIKSRVLYVLNAQTLGVVGHPTLAGIYRSNYHKKRKWCGFLHQGLQALPTFFIIISFPDYLTYQFSAVQFDDAVAVCSSFLGVGNLKEGDALLLIYSFKEFHDFDGGFAVEVSRRLVCKKYLRLR